MSGGVVAGAVVGAPVTSEILHAAYTEIIRDVRNKKPKLLDVVPPSTIAFGYWPHANRYEEYSQLFGKQGQIAGFFVDNELSSQSDISEINKAKAMDKSVMLSLGYNIHDPDRFRKYAVFARRVKLLGRDTALRVNYEANQTEVKKWFGIRHGEEFVFWWEEFVTFMKNAGVEAKFVLCLNSTEDIINTDPIELYIPSFGVDIATLDTYKRYHKNPYDPKHILPNFSAEEQEGHDLAVYQEKLPGVPLGNTEFGAEEDSAKFKVDVIAKIPKTVGFRINMSFEYDKSTGHGPHEVNWTSIKTEEERLGVLAAANSEEYMPDDFMYSFF